jgi:hypothetical protein
MIAAPSVGREAGNGLLDARERWNTYGKRTRDIRKELGDAQSRLAQTLALRGMGSTRAAYRGPLIRRNAIIKSESRELFFAGAPSALFWTQGACLSAISDHDCCQSSPRRTGARFADRCTLATITTLSPLQFERSLSGKLKKMFFVGVPPLRIGLSELDIAATDHHPGCAAATAKPAKGAGPWRRACGIGDSGARSDCRARGSRQ